MPTETFKTKRGELETYFDRTAVDAWKRLTSNAPVSGIRATVRKGRDEMRGTLLSWLPENMHGTTLLDAGCGTCALTFEAANRGANVTAVDVSQNLIDHAKQNFTNPAIASNVRYEVGDMLDSAFGDHDYVVAMDSLIHYPAADIVEALASLASRTNKGIYFTIAPSTVPLEIMHKVGKLFPKSDRSPAIQPVSPAKLKRFISLRPDLRNWEVVETRRIKSGFYISEAIRLQRKREV